MRTTSSEETGPVGTDVCGDSLLGEALVVSEPVDVFVEVVDALVLVPEAANEID